MFVEEEALEQPNTLFNNGFWEVLLAEAHMLSKNEPILSDYVSEMLLSHPSYSSALINRLRQLLEGKLKICSDIERIIKSVYDEHPVLIEAAEADLRATLTKDPACHTMCQAFLFFKGFLALQVHRIAHVFFQQGRSSLAFLLQSMCSEQFSIDIHPAASIGQGVFIDHAHSIVIGETAIVGDDVSILHSVTLGGKGNEEGIRHPKIERGVTIGAGASVLGNVRVGEFTTIAAGSIVLTNIPSHCTAVGVPARVIPEATRDCVQ